VGILARIIEALSTGEVKAEAHKGEVLHAPLFGPAGDDSPPLPDDTGYLGRMESTGGKACLGVVNETGAAPGEKRLYSRDGSGGVAATVWLQSDGTIVCVNGAGSITLQPSGVAEINGATITPAGDVVSLTGVKLSTHKHDPGTGLPIPG